MLDAEFAQQLQAIAPQLQDLLDRFAQARVLVVGDLAVDEFITGQVERISREAPVPILRHESTRQIPGGGANAVYNLAQLGAQVTAVGLVGADQQGRSLQQLFATAGIDTDGILIDPARPTVTKTRISGHSRQSVTQQIVRVDRKSEVLPAPELQAQLAAVIARQVPAVDALVCSDYGDGVFTDPVIQAVLQHRRVVVDAQQALERYAGAFLFTPNLPEAERAVGYPINTPERLSQAGRDLLQRTRSQQILITRGELGMALFGCAPEVSAAAPAEHLIPAFNRTQVFDVTGAGDTVVAGITLGLVAGGSAWEAAILGNLAASIVVRQFGTATTTVEDMKTALAGLLEAIAETR